MGDFSSRNSSSDKRNRKRFFSETGNSATEMHKLLTMKGLAKGADTKHNIMIPDESTINKVEDIKAKDTTKKKSATNSKSKEKRLSNTMKQLGQYLSEEVIQPSHPNYNTREIIYELIQDKYFKEIMYNEHLVEGIEKIQKELADFLEPFNNLNPKIKKLFFKFTPAEISSDSHFAQLGRETSILGNLLSNFVENLIFCELLVQGFAKDKSTNKIAINNKNYLVFVGSIQEDINGVDLTLIEEDTNKHIGIDITSNRFKSTNIHNKKDINTHVDIITFNYANYNSLFKSFLKQQAKYLTSKDETQPPFFNESFAIIRLKGEISRFMEAYDEYQKNIVSDGDQHINSNDLKD